MHDNFNMKPYWKCRNCGLRIGKALTYPVRCSCGAVDRGNKLGDRVAELLARAGITPDTWSEWRIVGGGMTATLVRIPPAERQCGCGKRKELLNDVHDYAMRWFSASRSPNNTTAVRP